jgi:lipoyl(octanoyl) transferase
MDFEIESEWRESHPGLYTARGKIMACGVRIRSGVSTHGISINVRNNLADLDSIRACGVAKALVDRMGDEFSVSDVFANWCRHFHRAFG